MKLFDRIRLRFRPLRLADPDFGSLTYMYVPRAPHLSYWEGEWLFPPTGSTVCIGLPGTVEGPTPEARAFYLALPGRYQQLLARVRPSLERVLNDWLGSGLTDVSRELVLTGFDIENPGELPTIWDISFETTGQKWLSITIPFVGDMPQEPVIDT